jgi:tRNA(Arg) A34 adenosine deaminase TadA
VGKHLIDAYIYDKQGRLLSHGQNHYNKSHPIQARFAKGAGQPDRIYLHAEIAALVRLKKGQIPYKIMISRCRKDGSSGLARPCAVCMAAIKHWGIQSIEYTI